ncbi:hypothetical protein ACROYT_G006023 [Oculina patagonica]
MAAARYSSEALQAMMEENLREFQRNPQRNLSFSLAHTDFNEWLRVWKMDIPETDTNNKDLYIFARKNKKKFYDLLVSEIDDLKSLKTSFGLEVKFSIKRNRVTQHMHHYFREREPQIFTKDNKDQIKPEFDKFIEKAKGEIEAWSERGSGWVIERIETAYINVARYQPLRGGTYLPLPPKLANKKAVINVQNRDNQCLKWALRAALFPPRDGKNPQRTSRYPVDDGINYNGIDFPTPVKQIDKLEAQNSNLAINVFGWEDDRVIPLRISKKEKGIPRICLMLIESGLIQHYCFIKRVSALLHDQNKHQHKNHFCMLCLTCFTRADLLENHEKYCNGVNGRPTRIEMPEEGKNTLYFKNYQKQMKAPFVIYADFEALLIKMQGCKRETPEDRQKRKDLGEDLEDLEPKSYTEKTEQHEACGFAYTVVRSDGKHEKPVVYRGENAVEVFLKRLLIEEEKIRNELSTPKPLKMKWEDWKMSKISKESKKEVKCVANNMEKYITFSLGGLRFIDSLNFLKGKLEKLVGAVPKELLNITKDFSGSEESEECFELLCKKGIYPYEYMDSWKRFKETSLPEKEKFYSKLSDEHITDEDYAHAQKVWKTFGCRNLGDYHNLYVQTDVTLLADVFENFRKNSLEKYELDPAHYYTLPGLSWDALEKDRSRA